MGVILFSKNSCTTYRFENMDELRPEEGSSSSASASSGYSSASDDEVSNVDKRTGYRARKRIRSMISNVASIDTRKPTTRL